MSLPRYAEYKDSGVEWLGEVPAHWLITPVKHLGKLKGGAGFPHVEQGHETEELPFHKVNALGRAGSDGVLWGSENNISRATAERLGAYIFPAHALVFAKVGAALLLGRIRTLGEAACIDNNMMGLVVDNDDVDVAFVSYALNLVRFDLIANPGAVPSLNEGQIGNFPLVLPSRSEQSAIAAFLDRETGKIDALIAEQEKLLTLLAEKRQVTISHAVTRGLNPNAPMKDSGAPWLGEVPTHWDVLPIKRLGTIRYGIGEPPTYRDEGIPLIRATNVHAGIISRNGLVYVDPDDIPAQRILWLKSGDIIVVRSGAYTGDSALVTDEYAGCIAGFDMVLSLNHCAPDFMQYALLGHSLKIYQIDLKRMRAAQPHLNAEELGECVIALPEIGEQAAISDFLAIETAKIDSLCIEADHVIELLKERRSALIAAAVTGKVDVRQAA